MSEDDLPTDLWVAAQARAASREGVPVLVVRRGASASGSIILKVNRLDGTSDLYDQVRLDETRVWMKTPRMKPLPEEEAAAYIARRAEDDPDLWVVEVEDKQGRLWFPGKVVNPE